MNFSKLLRFELSPEGQGNIGYDTPGAAAALVPPIANNGLSLTAGVIQLGGPLGSASAAQLLNSREIPLNGFLLQITMTASAPARQINWQFVDANDSYIQVNINSNTFTHQDQTNTNAGNSARCGWRAINDLGHTANLSISSSTYTANGFLPDTVFIENVNATNLCLNARTGSINFSTGGFPTLTTINGIVNAAGNWIIGKNLGTLTPTDNGANFQHFGSLSYPIRFSAISTALAANTDHTLVLTAGGLTITNTAPGAGQGNFFLVVNQSTASNFSVGYIPFTGGAAVTTIPANATIGIQWSTTAAAWIRVI